MTGIENILKGINTDSEKICESIIRDAKTKADEIIKEAEKSAKAHLVSEKEKAQENAENIISRGMSRAELLSKKIFLSNKQELIGEAIENAKAKLLSLDGAEYQDVLKNIIKKNLQNAEGEIIFSETDKKSLKDDFLAFLKENNLTLSEKNLPEKEKGFIISYSNTEENCTFSEIFDANREAFSDKVQSLLFD